MTTEAEAIAALAAAAQGAESIVGNDGREYLVHPTGTTVVNVSDQHGLFTATPRYIKQAVTLQTLDSLNMYVNRHKTADTVLFANIDRSTIVAAIDWHGAEKAAHVAHRATLQLAHSVEWAFWTSISGQLKGQLEFARCIEENAADIVAPDAATLLESIRDLQAHRSVNFIKAVRTSTDCENFEYTDETTATSKRGTVELPTQFKLALPVYFGEPTTELFAFLRWKFSEDKKLSLGIQLHRAEHVRQAVFKQIVLGASEATNCPAVFGAIG